MGDGTDLHEEIEVEALMTEIEKGLSKQQQQQKQQHQQQQSQEQHIVTHSETLTSQTNLVKPKFGYVALNSRHKFIKKN